MARAILLLLIWVTTTVAAATSDTPMACEAGLCTAGTRTSVTCNFNEDISVSRQAFSVVRYPLSASRDDIGAYICCAGPCLSQTRRYNYVYNQTNCKYISEHNSHVSFTLYKYYLDTKYSFCRHLRTNIKHTNCTQLALCRFGNSTDPYTACFLTQNAYRILR